MDLGYSSSEDEGDNKNQDQNQQVQYKELKVTKKLKKNPFAFQSQVTPIQVNLNPDADISDKLMVKQQQEMELYKQQNPEKFRDTSDNITTGRIDKINNGQLPEQDISLAEFDEQQKNFRTYGFAYDPKKEEDQEQRLVVNEFLHPELYKKQIEGQEISKQDIQEAMLKAYGLQKKNEKKIAKDLKEKRNESGNSSSMDFQGPWANYKHEQLIQKNNLTDEDKQKIKEIEDKRKQELEEEQKVENDPKKRAERITSIFHLAESEKRDYQGRSYLMPPSDLKQREQNCFIPKKCIKTWNEHTKGVSCIKFYPKYGHYILSASLDGTCKLFSTTGNKQLTRTYMGHGQAVRDICFNYNGRNFISGGYDKTINYWDTETGKIIQDIKLKAYPKSIKIHPNEANEHSFILGSSNKKIMQYDLRSGKRTQVYDEHLGGINTITFIDNNKKFVSTSDDNKMFVWEYGIPIVIKHVAEPDMQCVYATQCSSNHQFMAAQQANNKIAIWDLKGGNFKMNRKKAFVGHKSAGYAIGMSFSNDGKYFCSGDSDGRAFFWDWKTNKCYKALDAHDGVCIDVAWHPIEQSKVATCGWDGMVKYWD